MRRVAGMFSAGQSETTIFGRNLCHDKEIGAWD